MTLDEVYQACLKMKDGDEEVFFLDEQPDWRDISALQHKIAKGRGNRSEVLLQSCGNAVTALCYTPVRLPWP